MNNPMPNIPPGGVLLNKNAPRMTFTFRRDKVEAKFENFGGPPLGISVCHLMPNGSMVIVIEPQIPSGGGIPNSIVPPGLVG